MKRIRDARFPRNFQAWAIGSYEIRQDGRVGRFHVRCIVWGRLMARAEKRDGEVIRRAYLLVQNKVRY
jgi:hypothetical protein